MQKYPTIKIDNIVSHKEAAAKGYASNHGDPENWLTVYGKDMDWFRELVKKKLSETDVAETPLHRVQVGAYKIKENAQSQLNALERYGYEGFIVKSGDIYRVQVGAFKVKDNAENYLKELERKGFEGFVVTVNT